MIPVNLKLSNFTSYGENTPELDFTKFKIAAISGLNGAGKSSLLDAITWCVWGSSRAGDGSDELVRLGQDQMQVEFSFDLDNHNYIIKRRRSKKSGGNTSLEFWSKNHNLTEGTIKATQQKIIDTLHLSYETFTNSSFLRQGHADEFTIHGPTDRKRILADILGLDHYDKLEERAKEKAKDAQTKLTLLDYQMLEIETELSQKQESEQKLKVAQKKIDTIDAEILNLEKQLKILIASQQTLTVTQEQKIKLEQNYSEGKIELEEILLKGKERIQRIVQLEEQIKKLPQLDLKIADLKNLQKEAQNLNLLKQTSLELEKNISTIQGKIDLKNSQLKQLNTALEKIQTQLENLKETGAKCPTCGQEIDKEHKLKVTQDLLKEQALLKKQQDEIILQEEQIQLKKFQDELAKIPLDNQKLLQIQKDLEQFEILQIQKESLLQNQASLETEKNTVVELRGLYKKKLIQVKDLEKELAKMPDLSNQLTDVKNQITEKENRLSVFRSDEKEARNTLGQIKELISRTEQLEKLFKQKTEDKLKFSLEKEGYEELALAFGKRGIQAMIIESAIPEIEDEANKLLDKLTEGRMKVALETQKETKTKVQTDQGKIHATVETLDIIISDEMGERPYELYSGGETFRVNFALRLAISKLLANRAGARLQFLVIDEGFGTQDAPGRARLVEVLDTIKDDFEKILIITHIDELKEEFPIRIEVSKNAGGSTFEVVGI